MKLYQSEGLGNLTSILIIAATSGPMFRLKKNLENQACVVTWFDPRVDRPAGIRHCYFDAIMLDREEPAITDFLTKIFTTLPELIHCPVLLLSPPYGINGVITGLKLEITHNRIKTMIDPDDVYSSDILLNLVKQISYLVSRYN